MRKKRARAQPAAHFLAWCLDRLSASNSSGGGLRGLTVQSSRRHGWNRHVDVLLSRTGRSGRGDQVEVIDEGEMVAALRCSDLASGVAEEDLRRLAQSARLVT